MSYTTMIDPKKLKLHEDWLKRRGLHLSQLKESRIIDEQGREHARAPNDFPDLTVGKRGGPLGNGEKNRD